jgi:hypothetical protein
MIYSLFVSLVYCAESTVRWFVVRENTAGWLLILLINPNEHGDR